MFSQSGYKKIINKLLKFLLPNSLNENLTILKDWLIFESQISPQSL